MLLMISVTSRVKARTAQRMVGAGVLLGLMSPAVPAHDFWIEPSTFQPEPNEPVHLSLRVGEHFKGEPVPRNSEKIESFTARGPNYFARKINGLEGADPAGTLTIELPGMYVVGYRNKRTRIELEPEKFQQYLKEEGLERVMALRAERGETNKPGREVYSRSAKVVLNLGEPSAMAMEPSFRFTFEIVPLRNPSTVRVGMDDLTVRCLYNGAAPDHPLTVVAMRKDKPENPIRTTTDKDGKATFALDAPGVWMIKAIHMAPAPADADADWESIWASLVFEIPNRKP